jgi:hypothetical protein
MTVHTLKWRHFLGLGITREVWDEVGDAGGLPYKMVEYRLMFGPYILKFKSEPPNGNNRVYGMVHA